MRIAIASIAAAAVGFALATVLGVAFAETSTSSTTTSTSTATAPSAPARTVSVVGVGTAPVEQGANSSQANAAYHQAMGAAVGDGHGKAEYLAAQVGAALGQVQSVAEGGGAVECKTAGEYFSYEGEQPDFGRSERSVFAPAESAPAATPKGAVTHRPSIKHKHTSKRPTARAASVSCTVSAQVSLVYSLS